MPTAKECMDAGVAFLSGGQLATAKSFFLESSKLDPANPMAWSNLMTCALQLDQADEGEEYILKALEIDPADAHLWCQYGALDIHRQRIPDAMRRLNQAIMYDPSLPEPHINYGYLYQLTGDYERSRRAYEQALMLNPANMEVRGWYGMVLLSLGQWSMGLSQYEARLGAAGYSPLKNGVAVWSGEPLQGKTICVWSEQGAGDCIMMFRYLNLLKENWGASHVYFACPSEIGGLVVGQCCAETYGDIAKLPRHDYQVSMLSLLLHIEKAQVATSVKFPYLEPPTKFSFEKLDATRASGGDKLNIGFSFSGNSKHRNDRYRSMPAAKIRDCIDNRIANWWLLQSVDLPVELDAKANKLQTPSLATLASAVSEMDLIVTVDTLLAHIAGAMDIPCFVMLPANADWRWTLSGITTRWYPSMRLIRQPKLLDWDTVIKDVRASVSAIHSQSIAA